MDSLCASGGGAVGGEHGEASSPGPPGTKGLTLRPPASSQEEGRASGSDPSPGSSLTSPFSYSLHFWWAHASGAFGGVGHLCGELVTGWLLKLMLVGVCNLLTRARLRISGLTVRSLHDLGGGWFAIDRWG